MSIYLSIDPVENRTILQSHCSVSVCNSPCRGIRSQSFAVHVDDENDVESGVVSDEDQLKESEVVGGDAVDGSDDEVSGDERITPAAEGDRRGALGRRDSTPLDDDDRGKRVALSAFKAKWSEATAVGSFQCKLSSTCTNKALASHLADQGFQIVFEKVRTSTDYEIAICSVRTTDNSDDWFLARFHTKDNSFSAVMKGSNDKAVAEHVRKFALAKILKILQ